MNETVLTTLLIGLIFLLAGIILRMFPPKKINWLYGYRTPTSMKNIDTWIAGNKYSARFMIFAGIIFTILGLLTLLLPDPGFIGVVIVIGFLILSVIILVIATERHLNKIFNQND